MPATIQSEFGNGVVLDFDNIDLFNPFSPSVSLPIPLFQSHLDDTGKLISIECKFYCVDGNELTPLTEESFDLLVPNGMHISIVYDSTTENGWEQFNDIPAEAHGIFTLPEPRAFEEIVFEYGDLASNLLTVGCVHAE